MIPIYMHEICGYESKILTVDLKHDLPNFERGIYFIKVKRIFGFLGNFAYWVKLLKKMSMKKVVLVFLFAVMTVGGVFAQQGAS